MEGETDFYESLAEAIRTPKEVRDQDSLGVKINSEPAVIDRSKVRFDDDDESMCTGKAARMKGSVLILSV